MHKDVCILSARVVQQRYVANTAQAAYKHRYTCIYSAVVVEGPINNDGWVAIWGQRAPIVRSRWGAPLPRCGTCLSAMGGEPSSLQLRELQERLHDYDVQDFTWSFSIVSNDATALFSVMDEDDRGRVDISEFEAGRMRLTSGRRASPGSG